MSVSGIGQNYYRNNVASAQSKRNVSNIEKADSFVGRIIGKNSISSEDMTLEEYKKYFNEKMNSLYTHPSQKNMNWVIDITDTAYERMQSEPEYEKKILDALAKNKAVDFGGNIPQMAYTHIDDTYEKCYGYTQGMKENVGYSGSSSSKSRNSAGSQKKARQKELLEEYLEKRQQAKEFQQKVLEEKIAKQDQERNRLLQLWNNESQLAKASNGYEANIMMETVADGNSLFG